MAQLDSFDIDTTTTSVVGCSSALDDLVAEWLLSNESVHVDVSADPLQALHLTVPPPPQHPGMHSPPHSPLSLTLPSKQQQQQQFEPTTTTTTSHNYHAQVPVAAQQLPPSPQTPHTKKRPHAALHLTPLDTLFINDICCDKQVRNTGPDDGAAAAAQTETMTAAAAARTCHRNSVGNHMQQPTPTTPLDTTAFLNSMYLMNQHLLLNQYNPLLLHLQQDPLTTTTTTTGEPASAFFANTTTSTNTSCPLTPLTANPSTASFFPPVPPAAHATDDPIWFLPTMQTVPPTPTDVKFEDADEPDAVAAPWENAAAAMVSRCRPSSSSSSRASAKRRRRNQHHQRYDDDDDYDYDYEEEENNNDDDEYVAERASRRGSRESNNNNNNAVVAVAAPSTIASTSADDEDIDWRVGGYRPFDKRRRSAEGMKIHMKGNRYECVWEGCGKSFSTSGHLARHARIHLNLKRYECTFPGCTSRFVRNDNLRAHIKTHENSYNGSAKGCDGGNTGAIAASKKSKSRGKSIAAAAAEPSLAKAPRSKRRRTGQRRDDDEDAMFEDVGAFDPAGSDVAIVGTAATEFMMPPLFDDALFHGFFASM